MAKSKAVSCHKTKTAAKTAQKKVWAKGRNARITKTKKGYCVRDHGKRKVGVIKATGQRVRGKRK